VGHRKKSELKRAEIGGLIIMGLSDSKINRGRYRSFWYGQNQNVKIFHFKKSSRTE